MSLAAVAGSFVGDIAYVIRIETLRSTPLIVDASAIAKAAPDRLRTLRLGLLESWPGKLLRESAPR
jgi:hypothetical protein